jgi:hypothetical protein
LWKPEKGPQTVAYMSPADELFYGGAAGGGKTSLVLGTAITAHTKTLFLRRQATQLVEAVDQLKEYCSDYGRWSGRGYGGLMRLKDGRTVELAGVDHEDDKQHWKGRPHDLKTFDEICDFTESQYEFISAWNRTTDVNQRCRRICTGNPPSTPEGEWVIRRWAPWLDPSRGQRAKPGDLLWYARVDGGEVRREDGRPFVWKKQTIHPWSRTFIPALLKDNPYLERTGYARTLDALPEPLRSQLLYGDFSASRIDDPYQVIPTAWLRAAQRRWQPDPPAGERLSAVGCDIARGGGDATVLSPRRGIWFAPLVRAPGPETPDGPAAARLIYREVDVRIVYPEDRRAAVNVDIVGIGSAAFDEAKRLGLNVWPVNGASKPYGRDRAGLLQFANLRAYAYWSLREALDPEKGDSLQLPDDPELLADLSAPRWQPRPGGIIIEPKDDIRERLGRSPDAGDAVCLSWLQAAAQNEITVIPRKQADERRHRTRNLFGARR